MPILVVCKLVHYCIPVVKQLGKEEEEFGAVSRPKGEGGK